MNPFRNRHAVRPVLMALGSAVLLAAPVTVPSAAAAVVEEQPRSSVALDWYDTTAATIAAGGAPTQVTNSRTWAISWLAAARATRQVPSGVDRGDFQDAALASAVHDALVALIPSRTQELDAALRTTLQGVPDGPAESKGVAAGARQARLVLAAREGDGLDPASVNAPFTVPPHGPWSVAADPVRLRPGRAVRRSRLARPFLLDTHDQYRLPAPPAQNSARYRADLAEVRAYGAVDSTVRTQKQTETATFWLGSSLTLYTEPLRVALARSPHSSAERARLVALFHVALVDTQIATSDTKYAYLRWRPVTAIRTGSIDPDPAWTPLHTTPTIPTTQAATTRTRARRKRSCRRSSGPARRPSR